MQRQWSLVVVVLLGGLFGCTPEQRPGLEHGQAGAQPAAHHQKVGEATREDREGWIILKLHGSPHEIGYAHGRALAAEIDDSMKAVRLDLEHVGADATPEEKAAHKDWAFYRDAATRLCIPHLGKEYREELGGIAQGMAEQGYTYDLVDLVAYNAYIELSDYYAPSLNAKPTEKTPGDAAGSAPAASHAPDRCSAFIATGSSTRDGNVVIGHNTWDGYLTGARCNIILDITPAHGHRFVMDTMPGMIHSGTDWFINDAGIAITETTIGDFEGFDPAGVPEFVRARRAAQYSSTIDEVYATLRTHNNGGYANAWLIGDIKTGEIAKLELGLKNVIFHRTMQGWYCGANFPDDSKLTSEECPAYDRAADSCEVRRERWKALLDSHKGSIDAAAAKSFLADTTDGRTGAAGASSRTLCGRSDVDADAGFHPSGAVNAKAADAEMIRDFSFWARMGIPNGENFLASDFLGQHGEDHAWMKPHLRDLPGHEWILFRPGKQ